MKKFLSDHSVVDPVKVLSWQTDRLRHIITYAYEQVPGYHLLYDDAGISPRDFEQIEDIKRFPFVTKEMIRDNLNDFTARSLPQWKLLYRTTGGSTGVPFGFHLTQQDVERELAFMHTAWERVGWNLGDSSAILRGAFIGTEQNFWSYDPYFRELSLSTYYLTEKTYEAYRRLILERHPDHLQAYPSSATRFAEMVKAHGDEQRFSFRLLLLGSENLYPWQLEQLHDAFPSARLYGWYGHAEQVLFAPLCVSGPQLHLDPHYGFAEVLGPSGDPVAEGHRGELIGTSFWNIATPFIRYRTRDIALLGPFGCQSCGQAFQVLERIEGRVHEFILTGTGRLISMTQINMHSAVFDHVRQFQFYQKERGKVTLRIIKKESYGESDTDGIKRELQAKLGNDMQLTIEFVDSIAPLASGKTGFLQQELSLEHGDHGRDV